MSMTDQCAEACAAMPECSVCGMRKHPRGRGPGIEAASGYCSYECPGRVLAAMRRQLLGICGRPSGGRFLQSATASAR
jgi:hypothetical protein